MILIASSPTGGHFYPAIALAQKSKQPCIIISSKGKMDENVLAKYGISQWPIEGNLKRPFGLIRAIITLRKKIKMIQKKEPITELIGMGGYATVPAIIAAKSLAIPITLYEQNLLPGRVTRLFSRWARQIHTAFPGSRAYFSKALQARIHITANPIRTQYPDDPIASAVLAQLNPTGPVVLVMGGSQGAHSINKWLVAEYETILNSPITLIHITGQSYFPTLKSHLRKSTTQLDHFYKQGCYIINDQKGVARIIVVPYIENMAMLYKASTVVLARAGATSLAEIAHHKRKAILVPYPHAKDNHQLLNAEAFIAQYPESRLCSEAELKQQSLLQLLVPFMPK